MRRRLLVSLFGGLAVLAWIAGFAGTTTQADNHETTGQGSYKFKVVHSGSHLPSEAQAVLEKAHGGFAIDRRDGRGEIYFALPGAGIIQISADMSKTRMLATEKTMADLNMHNASIWYDSDGNGRLSFPSNGSAQVFTTGLDGKLLHTLDTPPASADLGAAAVKEYFDGGGKFVPTDADRLGDLLYVATGYSDLDYVLTAKIASENPLKLSWHNLAFGGKGEGVGQFGTGHGITIPGGTERVDVADRPRAEIDRFSKDGKYLETITLPEGAFPCDVDYLGNLAVVGALFGKDREIGAPIYILEDDKLVSTLQLARDLGLEKFNSVHNAVLHKADGKLYVIAQAWNPGDFAILEQVM